MDKNANRSWELRKAVASTVFPDSFFRQFFRQFFSTVFEPGSARRSTFRSFTQADQCVSCATYIKLTDAGCYSPGPQVN